MKLKRLIDVLVPITACNFRCHYCYVTQQEQIKGRIPQLPDVALIKKAFSKKRLGGACYINFCGQGETLLQPEIPAIVAALLQEGHFIVVITNGSLPDPIDELLKLPKVLRQRLMFLASFHFLELKRLGLIEHYFSTIKKMRAAGVSFNSIMTVCDELIPYKDEIKEMCIRNLGAYCNIAVGRDDTKVSKPILTSLSENEYSNIWSDFNSELFKFQMSNWGVKQTNFCYAGDIWSTVNLETGDLKQCYSSTNLLQNIYSNVNEPIKWKAYGRNCLEPHCFNGVAAFSIGAVPALNKTVPSWIALRNKVCTDGTEWFNPTLKKLLSTKMQRSPIQRLLVEHCGSQKLTFGTNQLFF
ncbi:hypothetical protein AGMMS50255_5550 [Spirochaetia bacterium]|nr:hypothetical protein AGMMS50255_5550 [Spirochaetia bacterium]